MPAERITMRQVREILRLMSVGDMPVREIGRRTGVAPSTVRATLKRIASAGLNWPLPEGLSDSDLEAQLYRNAGKKQGIAAARKLTGRPCTANSSATST